MRKGRRKSANIEDRRADPKGATRFSTEDNPSGDITFKPPMRPNKEPAVLPYRDPEAQFNRMGEEYSTDFRKKMEEAQRAARNASRTLAAGKAKRRYSIAAGG